MSGEYRLPTLIWCNFVCSIMMCIFTFVTVLRTVLVLHVDTICCQSFFDQVKRNNLYYALAVH